MPHHPLRNFEIENNYQNEPKFNGIYSRNNLPKIKGVSLFIKQCYYIVWSVERIQGVEIQKL